MKKVILAFLLLALALTLGCGGKTAPEGDTSPETSIETTTDLEGDAELPAATSAAVTEVDSDLADLNDLDDSFLSDELESLDSELDFEI